MKAIITADLHYDLLTEEERTGLAEFARRISACNPDVFVIAGDMVGLGKKYLREALEVFRGLSCPKYALPGNHDLWVPEGNSLDYLEGRYSADLEASGFQRLEKNPFVLEGTAVVGVMGWYDYSFADPGIVEDRQTSYQRKSFCGKIVWNDAHFVRLPMDDRAYALEEEAHLKAMLAGLPGGVSSVLAVTHVLAFFELVERRQNKPEWNFANAFMGSRGLGQLLRDDPRVCHHVCGHSHGRGTFEMERLVSRLVGSTYRRKEFLEVVL